MLDAIYQNPMAWIGLVFAVVGAWGFAQFCRGFFTGLPHLFTQSMHEEHLEHHRHSAMHGAMLMLYTFILWEIVRAIAHSITG